MKKRFRVLLLVIMTMFCVAFAAAGAEATERDIEWGSYQNSQDNNGVVGDIPLPTSYNETSLKWAEKLVSGYTTSFTPPLIIDSELYVASTKHVLKIDKTSGEILRQSEELLLNVGYAMNPITYDEEKDQIYIPILNGRVQCLDAETLQSKWVSKEYRYNQTLSPIACKGGMVYTGIWETEKDDGVFFCLNADTGEEIWSYTPSVDGADAGDFPHGFYWAGAYVNEDYVIVGSDDGFGNGFAESGTDSYPESAVVYSFNRRTGEVIDRITGIKGDVRCTILHSEGNIYFVSKGGRLYKAALGADGKFGPASCIQLKDRYGADSMMTATPVVYNGRIYVGAAGSKGQFSADGGHFFAVIEDSETLSDSSLIYTVPVSGYAQAAPILSTMTEGTDGKVRLYFTFNAFPGGIYYLEDSPSSTATSHENAHILFRPEKEMQQYCISPLCCDREGTMYFKNDSGYLMAVAVNKAWLEDISVTSGGGDVEWKAPFDSGQLKFYLYAPAETASVKVTPTVPEGYDMTVTINDQPIGSSGMDIPLIDESAEARVRVSRTVGDKTSERTYTLHIVSKSDNADLAGFALVAENNNRPNYIVDTENSKACNKGVGYDPQFDPSVTEYVGKTYNKDKAFINLWLQTADAGSTIRVLPAANVGNSNPNMKMNIDGTLEDVSGRYPIYWVKNATSAEVDVEVTSPSGRNKKTYHITLVRGQGHLDVGQTPLNLSPSLVTLNTKGNENSTTITAKYDGEDVTESCTFESADPDIAVVDETGRITAVKIGETDVWVNYNIGNNKRRGRVHVDVTPLKLNPPTADIPTGEHTQSIQVTLNAEYADANIRYVVGEGDEELTAPMTTTGELYTGPIAIDGVAGQKKTVKIKAIAYGSGYSKSVPAEFVYTIDRTGEPGTDPTDPTGPTSPTDPTTPTDPTDPTTPTDPTDPTTPTNPTDPTTPTDPTSPTSPTDPTTPTSPTTPTDPTSPTTPTTNPTTKPTTRAATPPTGKVTILNTIANSARKANDVIWDKSKVKGATNYELNWRVRGAGKWNTRTVGNVVRGTTTGLKIRGLYEIRVRPLNKPAGTATPKYGVWSNTVYRYFHTTEKIKLVSKSKGSFTMSWKNNPEATGYQVMFTTNKNGSGAAKNINNIGKGKTSFTKKGLKSGVTYYVQVREMRKVGGIGYVGNISCPVAVRVK